MMFVFVRNDQLPGYDLAWMPWRLVTIARKISLVGFTFELCQEVVGIDFDGILVE